MEEGMNEHSTISHWALVLESIKGQEESLILPPHLSKHIFF